MTFVTMCCFVPYICSAQAHEDGEEDESDEEEEAEEDEEEEEEEDEEEEGEEEDEDTFNPKERRTAFESPSNRASRDERDACASSTVIPVLPIPFFPVAFTVAFTAAFAVVFPAFPILSPTLLLLPLLLLLLLLLLPFAAVAAASTYRCCRNLRLTSTSRAAGGK